MTMPQLALLAATALTGTGTALAATPPASPAPRYDAAYAIFAVGDDPLSAGPNAFSNSSRIRGSSGGARSADGRQEVRWGHTSAGDGQASAAAYDVYLLSGAIRVTAVTALCRNGAAVSQVSGVTISRLHGKATVAFDVRTKNQDGSTTVIGMQVRVHAGRGSTINVAAATCAPVPDRPTPPRPPLGSARPASGPSGS
ncbi:hypothetical protein [Actinoplanes sp. HUAS TT8]|uniref:hypothetical protein n=1 Tax=Actinoplanes sp. HUAS TT8 TaxID=3447453 RepID=UPI003F524937